MNKKIENGRKLRAGSLFLLLLLLAGTLLGSACISFAEVPKPVSDGVGLITYAWKTGNVTVYKDSARSEKAETIKGDATAITVSKYENSTFYCTFKVGGERHRGWIPASFLMAQPNGGRKDALLRYSVSAYNRPNGRNLGKIPGYTDIDVLGKKGGWYQIVYKYKKNYWMAWITAGDYTSSLRIFDGSEKRLMAEGVYTMALADNLRTMVTSRTAGLVTANARKKASQRFEFRFAGQNCYQVFHNGTNKCLTAEMEDGSYTGNVVMQEASSGTEPGQIWQLIRKDAYYFLKNKGTGLFLTAGDTYTTQKYRAALPQRFRIVMAGGKNLSHWQVFSQYDTEWGALKYGRTNTMAASACGVLSSVNAVYALNGQFMDPMEVAAYAVKTGYRVEGSGTDYRFVQAAANHFGKKYGYAFAGSTYNLSTFTKHLQNGGTAVVYVPHHYICVADYKDGKYLVLDPYATAARKASPFGCWVSGSRFQSGTLRSQNYLLLKATN